MKERLCQGHVHTNTPTCNRNNCDGLLSTYKISFGFCIILSDICNKLPLFTSYVPFQNELLKKYIKQVLKTASVKYDDNSQVELSGTSSWELTSFEVQFCASNRDGKCIKKYATLRNVSFMHIRV